jgi:exopolysaccharide biosynthesis protein
MKTLVVIGILFLAISGQAFSMGHPHNMFAARKQMKSKTSTSIAKAKATSSVCWQQTVRETKAVVGERLLLALLNVRPARPY